MKGDERVRYGVKDGVATITFNRPDKLNAMTFAMRDAFIGRVDEAGQDAAVRVVVIEGAGSTFTAGVDVEDHPELQDPSGTSIEEDEAVINAAAERWLHLWLLPKPVIIKARGYCVGWGLEMALHADLVVASVDCQFFFPSIRNGSGLPDSSMAIYNLGVQWSKRLLLTGEAIDGATAARHRARSRGGTGRGPRRGGRRACCSHRRTFSGCGEPEQAGAQPCRRPDGKARAAGVRGGGERAGPPGVGSRRVEQAGSRARPARRPCPAAAGPGRARSSVVIGRGVGKPRERAQSGGPARRPAW